MINPALRYPAAIPTASRGSTLLLVLAALLLSLILGMTYLEIVRLDRKSTKNLLTSGNIDNVIQSVIDLAVQRIGDDLGINASNNFFAQDGDGDNIAEEAYDYPGDLDMWLAFSDPAGTTTPTFSQISWLGQATARQFIDPTTQLATDTSASLVAADASTLQSRFYDPADTDGDGISDSKPAIAPTASLDGVNYYMWVRIIDNSAMLNLNTTLSLINASGQFDTAAAGTDAPRFHTPAGLDLGGLTYDLGVNPSNTTSKGYYMGELQAFLNYRLGTSAALPTPWATRQAYWLDPARKYASYGAYPIFGINSEASLRHRNGLNNSLETSTILQSGTGLPTFLRGNLTELNYKAALANMGYSSSATPIATYFQAEPRHMLTTTSGHSIVRPLRGSETAGKKLKPDINTFLTANNISGLSTEIQKVLNTPVPFVPLNDSASLVPPTIVNYADRLAVAIKDYADADLDSNSLPHSYVTNYNGYYGVEALPFVSEVYVQHWFKPSVGVLSVTWNRQQKASIAIELRNPFNQTIDLHDVRMTIGTDGVDFDKPNSDIDITPHPTLAPGESVIIYQLGQSGANSDPNPITNLWTGSNAKPNVYAIQLKANINAFETGASVVISMYPKIAKNDTNTTVAYQKAQVDAINIAPAATLKTLFSLTELTNLTNGQARYEQISKIGNGNGINTITLRSTEFSTSTNGYVTSLYPAPYSSSVTTLGRADKTPLGPADRLAARNHQLIIANNPTGKIEDIGEIAQVALLNFSLSQTIPDVWNAGNTYWTNKSTMPPPYHLILEPAATYLVVPTTTEQLMHGQLLLGHFTTISPAEDGVDNDGHGIDGADPYQDQQLIPGTLNLNTASKWVMQSALPIPGLGTTVADNIIGFRDNTAGYRKTGLRTTKGFASVGEFFNIPNPLGTDGADNQKLSGTLVDFQADPPTATTTSAQGIVDDIEEKTTLGRWLAQVGAVRSDVFTAYILVRGYRGSSTLPESEKRVVVLIDRTRMTKQSDKPRWTMLGSY